MLYEHWAGEERQNWRGRVQYISLRTVSKEHQVEWRFLHRYDYAGLETDLGGWGRREAGHGLSGTAPGLRNSAP